MSVEWMLIRGSGLVAFAMLALATIWGLVLSLGVLPKSVKRLTFAHEALSVGALLATGVHMVALGTHDFIEFDLRGLLVPGASQWRPLAVAWGVVAFYGMLVVIVSFYLRKHIGQRYWRLLHFGSFGVFVGAMVHGIAAGTDTSHPAVFGLYVASAAAVMGLLVMRVVLILNPAKPERRERPAAARPRATRAEASPAESRDARGGRASTRPVEPATAEVSTLEPLQGSR